MNDPGYMKNYMRRRRNTDPSYGRTRSPGTTCVRIDATYRTRGTPFNPAAASKPKPMQCFGDLHRATLTVGAKNMSDVPQKEARITRTRAAQIEQHERAVAEAAAVIPFLKERAPSWPPLITVADVVGLLPEGIISGGVHRQHCVVGRHLKILGWVRVGLGGGGGRHTGRYWCRAGADFERLHAMTGKARFVIYRDRD
jgi:hypothetical protein